MQTNPHESKHGETSAWADFVRSLTSPVGWLFALAVVALYAVTQTADMHDARDEWPRSAAIKQIQNDDAKALRRQSAAQAMCASDHGPQVEAVWVNDYTVSCVSPRGARVASFSMETSHAKR